MILSIDLYESVSSFILDSSDSLLELEQIYPKEFYSVTFILGGIFLVSFLFCSGANLGLRSLRLYNTLISFSLVFIATEFFPDLQILISNLLGFETREGAGSVETVKTLVAVVCYISFLSYFSSVISDFFARSKSGSGAEQEGVEVFVFVIFGLPSLLTSWILLVLRYGLIPLLATVIVVHRSWVEASSFILEFARKALVSLDDAVNAPWILNALEKLNN